MNDIVRLVTVVTPDMVGAHEWHDIDYWRYPLWKCQRCKMQTKNVVAADARPCLPTKKGFCRVCHEQAATKTSVYCRLHRFEASRPLRKQRPLSDAQMLEMKASKTPMRVIAAALGVSVTAARSIVHGAEIGAYHEKVARLERDLGPCVCGETRVYIAVRRFLDDGPVGCWGCLTVRRESSAP